MYWISSEESEEAHCGWLWTHLFWKRPGCVFSLIVNVDVALGELKDQVSVVVTKQHHHCQEVVTSRRLISPTFGLTLLTTLSLNPIQVGWADPAQARKDALFGVCQPEVFFWRRVRSLSPESRRKMTTLLAPGDPSNQARLQWTSDWMHWRNDEPQIPIWVQEPGRKSGLCQATSSLHWTKARRLAVRQIELRIREDWTIQPSSAMANKANVWSCSWTYPVGIFLAVRLITKFQLHFQGQKMQ